MFKKKLYLFMNINNLNNSYTLVDNFNNINNLNIDYTFLENYKIDNTFLDNYKIDYTFLEDNSDFKFISDINIITDFKNNIVKEIKIKENYFNNNEFNDNKIENDYNDKNDNENNEIIDDDEIDDDEKIDNTNLDNLEDDERDFQKILEVKRVTKVVQGGKRLIFRIITVIGDTINKVGLGIGRSTLYNRALQNSITHAQSNLFIVPKTYNNSISIICKQTYGNTLLYFHPAPNNTGVIAGSCVKIILELAGFKNIYVKQHGSNNILNNARATILALKKLLKKYFFYENTIITETEM
uniref:Ribosomal protein S5 n=1 Tax=Spumella sp. NIES-1846 TaxID=2490549 RepID=A0A455RFQ9_9STRA|nr:ribosomal protein S5 [Spumella sp. NIES-1846]